MFDKNTPFLNAELLNWLTVYKLSIEPGKKLVAVYKEIINFVKIEPLVFVNIVNKLAERGCITENKMAVYKEKSKNILELGGYETFLSATDKGKKQLLLGWDFVIMVIPQEIYEEILKNICSLSVS